MAMKETLRHYPTAGPRSMGELIEVGPRVRFEARCKPSRWQAYTWATMVLKPAMSVPRALLNGGWPIGRSQLPNIAQLCDYYPSFARSLEALRVMPENDSAARAVVDQVRAILHSLPRPYEHYELAQLVDTMIEERMSERDAVVWQLRETARMIAADDDIKQESKRFMVPFIKGVADLVENPALHRTSPRPKGKER